MRNRVVCPECGKVRLETPSGTTVLPTIGMARKATGAVGPCSCGRLPHERPALVERPAVDDSPDRPGEQGR